MDIRSSVLAILVAGSPAPGINSVISAVTIEAINSGLDVIGIKWGFKRIRTGEAVDCVVPLTYPTVSSIHSQAGSILFTSKAQLTCNQEVDNVLRSLEHLRVRYLVTIGGVDTAHSAHLLSNAASTASFPLSIVHAPKTVYNDLPMPAECITFGFTTARDYGVSLCQNYKVDAKTLGRWYIISVIGQRAGHLAEGIGKGAAATVILIPEEFTEGKCTFKSMLDILEASMIKRLATGRDYGVIILTEGIISKLPESEVESLFGSTTAGYGMLAKTARDHIVDRLSRKGIDLTVCNSSIGSEIRSAPPNSADINLARDLGIGCYF
uniref:Phosphofructokinase domain-containing protein n=1 Tax=Spongospora subterranea TaxID=70186 RepID=A0A0H5QRE8_9EUKA|eukprot:CRZ04620.1 hypothetical protein [Spongospora subterranea]